MLELVEQRRIDRPSAALWATLVDFESIARWAPNVSHSCLTTDAKSDVGAARRVQVGRNALLERIIDWSPGEGFTYEIQGLPPIVRRITNSWRLDGQGDATVVTVTTSIEAGPRPPHKLAARAIGRAMSKASRQMLDGLASNHEEEPS